MSPVIRDWECSEASMTALCRAFGTSRQTGYRWIRRRLPQAGGKVDVLRQ